MKGIVRSQGPLGRLRPTTPHLISTGTQRMTECIRAVCELRQWRQCVCVQLSVSCQQSQEAAVSVRHTHDRKHRSAVIEPQSYQAYYSLDG